MTTPEAGGTITTEALRIVATVPDEIRVHLVQEHQLDQLVNISRPISLTVAGAAFGAVLAFIPQVHSANIALSAGKFSGEDLTYVIVEVVCIGVFIVSSARAWRGEKAALTLVREIKQRRLQTVTPPPSQAPIPQDQPPKR